MKATLTIMQVLSLLIALPVLAENVGFHNSSAQPTRADRSKNSASAQYDVVVSSCNFMAAAGSPDIPLANGVAGSSGVLWYYVSHGFQIPDNWTVPKTWISTLKDGPLHGALVPSTEYPSDFIYHPNEGYVGSDRVTFIVDADGKRFKVIQNITVTRGAPDTATPTKQCPDVPTIKEARVGWAK